MNSSKPPEILTPSPSPERTFALAHARSVRDVAFRLLEASDALVTLLEEQVEETIDVTGSLSRIIEQLDSLLGGDLERHLRSRMGVSKEDLGIDYFEIIPLRESREQEEPAVELTPTDETEGVTCENITFRKTRRRKKKRLSKRKFAEKQIREYYAEIALRSRKSRDFGEIRSLMTDNPFKTNNPRDNRIHLTHGNPRATPR